MSDDPAIRSDGKCARPGCTNERKLTVKSVGLPNLDVFLKRDPLFSARCCRTFHQVKLSMVERDAQAHKPQHHQKHRGMMGMVAA